MTLRSRLFPGDEELGGSKRSDDHPRRGRNRSEWMFKRPPWMRTRRMLALLAVCLTIFIVVYNKAMNDSQIPQDRPQPKTGRAKPGSSFIERAWARQYDPNTPQEAPNAPPRGARPPGAPGGARPAPVNEQPSALDFDGPVRFFYLAASLHGIARTQGHKSGNRNVLFAASDLQAAAELIPLACEMARWRLNFVHFAFMGRDELSLDEIKRLNNAQHKADCDVYWHDARPDYAAYSTDRRMEVSIAGALGHIDTFMHPEAVITAGSETEDDFFTRATTRKTAQLRQTHIALPSSELENLTWITRLEAKALHAWHAASVDILIQAPQETSGSLIRLLKSLARAQYGAFTPPRLTIELPHKVHQDTMNFINAFSWPPMAYQPNSPSNQLFLRRRIPDVRISEDESSMRFIESFYPTHAQNSHVLVLSPQAEMSPAYFHYLKFHLLEWRYGDMKSDELMGIALETPSSFLNGSGSFEPPKAISSSKPDEEPSVTSFLWQAPNSNAALFFADKWGEFHSFLTGLTLSKQHPRTRDNVDKQAKLLSKRYPAWTEHMLEFMRARGYFLAFPSPRDDPSRGGSPAVIHNELFQAPEEWLRPKQTKSDATPEIEESDVLEAPGDYLSTHHKSAEEDSLNVERGLLRSLQHILSPAPSAKPNSAEDDDPNLLPDPIASLNELTLLDYSGSASQIDDLVAQSDEYAVTFRRNMGGCDEKRANPESITIGHVDDLFCLEDFDGEGQGSAVEAAGSSSFKGDAAQRHPEESKRPVAEGRKGSAEHPKDHVEKAAAGPKVDKLKLPPLSEGHTKGGSGVASTGDATVDAARSHETSVIGVKANAADKVDAADLADRKDADDMLTDLQRSELDDWKAKQRKEVGDIANEPKPTPTAARKATETDEILSPSPTLDYKKALDEEDFLDKKAGAKKADPDDQRHPSEKPLKPAERQPGAGAIEDKEDILRKERAQTSDQNENAVPKKVPSKGRLRGYDQGGFDEGVRDERAAAAGRIQEGTARQDRGGPDKAKAQG